MAKRGDDLFSIQGELNQAFIEIEEVAILVPLEKRAELRAEELFGQMIRSCSTCRGSGHGVVALHSWT